MVFSHQEFQKTSLQKYEGCIHFCEILFIDVYIYVFICVHIYGEKSILRWRNFIGSLSRDIWQYRMIEISNWGYYFHRGERA